MRVFVGVSTSLNQTVGRWAMPTCASRGTKPTLEADRPTQAIIVARASDSRTLTGFGVCHQRCPLGPQQSGAAPRSAAAFVEPRGLEPRPFVCQISKNRTLAVFTVACAATRVGFERSQLASLLYRAAVSLAPCR